MRFFLFYMKILEIRDILKTVIVTDKRVIVSFLTTAVLAASLLLRIAFISNSQYSEAASEISAKVINVSESRGMIYDRNSKPLVFRNARTVLAVNPTPEALVCLKKELRREEYETAYKEYKDGTPFVIECEKYTGDCEDIVPLTVYDRYNENDTAVNLIGYLNGENQGQSGIEKAFDDYLSEASGSLSVRFSVDVSGRALSGKGIEVKDENYASEAGVKLTIDREIQRISEEAMERNGIKTGAVVVLDCETSEILAIASAPSFDRFNLEESLENSDSPFINRALSAYSVGSVFKPVVAACALEKGIDPDFKYICSGYIDAGGQRFHCYNQTAHGEISMSEAMAVSCNCYFINLGLQTGAQEIISLASELGFGKEITLAEGLAADKGILPEPDSIDSKAALGNLSFGQGTLLATPLQIAAMYCAFANGGYYREPYVLKELIDEDGITAAYYKSEVNNKVLPDSICEAVCGMLEKTVEEGSGKGAKPMCYEAAGKTATAQTGWYENGSEVVHTWFAGYYPADEPEYVIAVFKENGSVSSTDCAPVFRDIADGITSVYE